MTYTILYIVLAAIIAFVMAFFQYFHKTIAKNKVDLLLAGLRWLSIFSILLLLINPKINSIQYVEIPPVLNVLIDNSSSISYANQQIEVKNLIDKINQHKEINDKFTLNYYSFSDDLYSMDSLGFDKPETNIIRTLQSVESINKEDVSPTILITDGNQTFGNSYEYYRSNQPLYPVIVGDTVKYDDLMIDQINVNSYTYLNNKFPVEIFLRYDGKSNVKKKFSVKQNNQIVYSQILDFSEDQNSNKIQFYLNANTLGMQNYQCELETLPNEKNSLNNSKYFHLDVMNEQAKILIISEINHPDISMFKRSIEMNKQRKVTIINDLNKDIQLEQYQLVILYQPTKKFNKVFDILKEDNIFIITGIQTDWNFLNNVQNFFRKNIISKTENYGAVFNTGYSDFIINDIGFSNLPPLDDYFGEINFLSPSQTILFQNVDNFSTEEPLLVTFKNQNRRGAVLFGENSWKWRMLSKVEHESYETFDIFFNKLIQYLSSNKRANQLEIKYNPIIYTNTDAVIEAEYFDANYVFDQNANISLSLQNKDTKESNNLPFTLKENRFIISLNSLIAGNYNFKVSVDSKSISKKGSFTVLPYNIEQQFLSSNIEDLKKIAQSSKGSYFHINKVDKLFSSLLSDKRYKAIQKSTEKIVPLIDQKMLLFIVILLLSIEWFIRKYKGLT